MRHDRAQPRHVPQRVARALVASHAVDQQRQPDRPHDGALGFAPRERVELGRVALEPLKVRQGRPGPAAIDTMVAAAAAAAAALDHHLAERGQLERRHARSALRRVEGRVQLVDGAEDLQGVLGGEAGGLATRLAAGRSAAAEAELSGGERGDLAARHADERRVCREQRWLSRKRSRPCCDGRRGLGGGEATLEVGREVALDVAEHRGMDEQKDALACLVAEARAVEQRAERLHHEPAAALVGLRGRGPLPLRVRIVGGHVGQHGLRVEVRQQLLEEGVGRLDLAREDERAQDEEPPVRVEDARARHALEHDRRVDEHAAALLVHGAGMILDAGAGVAHAH